MQACWPGLTLNWLNPFFCPRSAWPSCVLALRRCRWASEKTHSTAVLRNASCLCLLVESCHLTKLPLKPTRCFAPVPGRRASPGAPQAAGLSRPWLTAHHESGYVTCRVGSWPQENSCGVPPISFAARRPANGGIRKFGTVQLTT